jgi:hypothetical protein
MYRSIIRVVDRFSGSRGPNRLARSALARGIVRYVQDLENARSVSQALAGQKTNLRTIEKFLVGRASRLRAPLILISEVQRSGGTLLSQLFDGHPDIAAHPHEIKIGHPTDEDWPSIDPALDANENFRLLFDSKITEMVREGYSKGKISQNSRRHPFFYVPRLQYAIYRHLYASEPPANPREILNHFLTGYFNAWLNYQGDLKAKRWITAFAPCLANHEANVAAFFATYPDGRIVQVLRDPATWYPSAKQHRKSAWSRKTIEDFLDMWCLSAKAMLRNKARYPDKVIIVRFEDLVGDTARTMRSIARELHIAFDPILLTPTFNGRPIRANSSFAVETSGVLNDTLNRQKTLTAEERALVEQRCRAIYDQTCAASLRPTEIPLRAGVGA